MNIPHQYQLFTAAQSRELDQRTIEEFGIDGFTLMEIAGTRAADFILAEFPSPGKGIIVCGRGNNAGDALVVARILSEHDFRLDILFVDGTGQLSPDCSKNLQLLKSLNPELLEFVNFEDSKKNQYDFVVDGMLGTGLNSDVSSPFLEVIDWINDVGAPVFSMDIPTGLNADTGEIMGSAVKASFTLAFGTLKLGFYLGSGYQQCGRIVFCELPFPSTFKKSSHFLLDEDWLQKIPVAQKQRSHKYDGGVVYIIAGSEGLTGAAILASLSAWSTGVGAVVLVTPKGLLPVYDKQLVHIIKKPVGTEEDVFFAEHHIEEVLQLLSEKNGVLLIGPGLGRGESTISFAKEILSRFEGKCIIDADGLLALNSFDTSLKPERSDWVLTPHPGELSAMTRNSSNQSRLEEVATLVSNRGKVILSKGLPSIIASLEGTSILTNFDTRIFSRAGYGDVLAGKIAGYTILSGSLEHACCLALTDGKKKAFAHLHESDIPLEPMDII